MRQEKSHYKFESLTDFHEVFGLQKPLHPMISLINFEHLQKLPLDFPKTIVLNFYKISYKSKFCGQVKYGQNYFDFGEGGLLFTAPNQTFESPTSNESTGSMLLIHPDFFLTYPLSKKIKGYGFFSYNVNEALHLSEKEKKTILSIFKIIDDELNNRIDDLSQDVMVAQIELLLSYGNRFYKRQFITRKLVNTTLLTRFEEILDIHFSNQYSTTKGIPKVQLIADELNVSPSYLSDMLRSLTGQNTQQHIQNKLLEKSKEILSTTNLTVSEIAYLLGFEHPQSFSRLFKNKIGMSPIEFRLSFN